MNSRLASVLFHRKTKRSKALGRRKLLSVRSMIVLLALCMACSPAPAPRPEVESPQEEPSNPTEEIVATEAPEEIMPTDSATEILPTEPPVAANPVIPIPDFDEILQFSAGGAAGRNECSSYPSTAGSILIEETGLDDLILCVFLENISTADPIQLTVEHMDGSGITLTSNDLILDHGWHRVYWDGFSDEAGTIQGWTADGNVKFAVSITWPWSLPEGNWSITASQVNGPSAYGSFFFSKPGDVSYISALDAYSEQEVTPVLFWRNADQRLLLPDRDVLIFSGGNYPPNTPVYILLYNGWPQPFLVQTTAVVSDDSGSIFGELAAPFDIGAIYSLYGITDPDTALSDPNVESCVDVVGNMYGAACDQFYVRFEQSLQAYYATEIPSSCPGAPPQQLIPNQAGYVCTRGSLSLQDEPSLSANSILLVQPETLFYVDSFEPACADEMSWWHVGFPNDTDMQGDDISGWFAEGSYEFGYFVCPLP